MGVDAVTRFWSHVDKSAGEAGCWTWTGCTDKWGYGQVYWEGKRARSSHRVVYQITYGEIPQGKLVCHHCDNPPCVNPVHLFLGTNQDNLIDAVVKGRHKGCLRPQRGELNFAAKLSVSTVCKIRSLFSAGVSVAEIARKTNVPYSNAWGIAHRKTWKHI